MTGSQINGLRRCFVRGHGQPIRHLPSRARSLMQAPAPSAVGCASGAKCIGQQSSRHRRLVRWCFRWFRPGQCLGCTPFCSFGKYRCVSASLNGHERLHGSKTIQGAWTLQYFGMRSGRNRSTPETQSGGAFELRVTLTEGLA